MSDLGGKAATALRWAGGATATGQLITWAMTILVIRILTPEDYGLMAMATVVIAFLMLVNELGLGAVIVQRESLDLDTVRTIFGITLIVNTLFFALLWLAAPLISGFFHEDRLTTIVRVLALQFVIAAFEIVPVAQLERNLDFKRKSLANLAANVAGGAASLVLAYRGLGVWALVSGNLVLVTTRMVLLNIAAPFLHLPAFNVRAAANALAFGGLVTLERAMWFLYSQADVFVVGRLLGTRILGVYSVAMQLASLVMHKTGGVLYEVAFPTFARTQEDRRRLSAYVLKAKRLVGFFGFPIFFGIASVAPEMVQVLLGSSWSAAAPALCLLSLVMPLRMASNVLPPALQGSGRPDVSVLNLLLALVVMPLAFLAGARWGLLGVCWSWVLAFPPVYLMMLLRSRHVLGVGVGEVLRTMALPALASAVMFGAVSLLRHLLGESLEPAIRLPLLIAAGAACYGALVWFAGRALLLEALALLKR
jgi:O-antigen/teichoic acid export membrane protein